jgi:hypothetical protein
MKTNVETTEKPALNKPVVMQRFNQGDAIKIIHEDGKIEVGEFHRYGATRMGAIAFFNGVMRFIDEQSLNVA